METLIGMLTLLLLALLTGAIFGWIAFFKVRDLRRTVENLQRQLLHQQNAPPPPSQPVEATPIETNMANTMATRDAAAPSMTPAPATAEAISRGPSPPPQQSPDTPPTAPSYSKPQTPVQPTTSPQAAWLTNLQTHWMIWLGGLCVGLAGIFLVKYSIEMGLLGPTARIVLALATGIALHGVAEWLRRRTGNSHPAFAALAGGASITLYAAVLAALHLYQLISPEIAFIALAVISLTTMALALMHGPVLVIIGLLAAYVVPLLVSTGSGNILTAMVYSLIISGAALWLIRYIYRPWLWYGVLAGGLGWWLISLSATQPDGIRGLYLAALAYSLLAIPTFDWLLNRQGSDTNPGGRSALLFGLHSRPLQLALSLIVLAQALSIAHLGFATEALLNWSPLLLVIMLAARHHPSVHWVPWLSLATQWLAWLYSGLTPHPLLEGNQHFLWFTAGMTALYCSIGWWQSRQQPDSPWWPSLAAMAPVLWLALAFLVATDLSSNWQWSIGSLLLGLTYIAASATQLKSPAGKISAVWLILAGHLAYGLAAAMLFREAGLTVALATQLISLTWLIKRFQLRNMDWLVKVVVALVLIRLTVNPWLLQYPTGVHWSLWTYGGATLCCVIAARLTAIDAPLRRWLEAASLHLLVLFLATETRYWLHHGDIFAHSYSLTEAAINTVLWSALGLVYHYRSQFSSQLQPLYQLASKLLMLLALFNYCAALTSLNPLSGRQLISATPIWNLLLLAYGAPVAMALLCYRYYTPAFRKLAGWVAGVGTLAFVSLEIRHLWQGTLDARLPMISGEQYSYSVVWLLMAAAAILLASRREMATLYKAGMTFLLVVIGKIFLIDMSDLEGLLRVASFMGLGLSLLVLAYFHKRVSNEGVNP